MSADAIAAALLVSASLAAGDDGTIGEWAERHRLALVVLPEAGYRSRPDADAAERRRLGRQDSRDLAAALGRVRGSFGGGGVAALLLTHEEVTGQAGRAWLQRLAEAARLAELELPRATRLAEPSDFQAVARRLAPAE